MAVSPITSNLVPITPLPTSILARVNAIPTKPPAFTLSNATLSIVPYEKAHATELHAHSCGAPYTSHVRGEEVSVEEYPPGEVVWDYMFYGPFGDEEEFAAAMAGMDDVPNASAYVVVDNASGSLLGMVCLLNHSPQHLKVEIGSYFLLPHAHRKGINREVVDLLKDLVFGDWGYLRLEWKCDARNTRSRASAKSLGFVFEGIQESHFIIKNRIRDTAWFRILRAEYLDLNALPAEPLTTPPTAMTDQP